MLELNDDATNAAQQPNNKGSSHNFSHHTSFPFEDWFEQLGSRGAVAIDIMALNCCLGENVR